MEAPSSHHKQQKIIVNINCSYTVIPSDSKPTSILHLSHCDQVKHPNPVSQLYVYTNTNTTDSSFKSCVHTLRASLSKALNHYYPFAGRLHVNSSQGGGRFEILCNSKGAQLSEATCEAGLDDWGCDMVPPQVLDHLVPKVDHGVAVEDMPLLVAQITRFQCGGLTLGLAICRVVLDGASLGNFMASWAKLARGENLDSSLVPLLDRSVLDSRMLNMAPRFEHLEFSSPPLWSGSVEKRDKNMGVLATAFLKLSRAQVQKLKKVCDFGPPKRSYTSFEVIGGHLWRCVCKVRYEEGNGGQSTRLTTLVNCRNRLSPPIPQGYFGNATFPTVAPICSFDDIVHKPLSYAVGNVRKAIERMDDEYVRSALDFIACQKDMNLLRENLYNSGGRGKGRGNPNVYLVGWTNFPFYATDFGWGKPAYMVPGSINSDGKAFLLHNGRNGDRFIVAVCLQASQVDALKKLFYEDIGELLPSSKL